MEEIEFSLGDSTSLGSFDNQPDGFISGEVPLYKKSTSNVMQDVRRLAETSSHTVMSSIIGVSSLAALTGSLVLLVIRPAFIIQRGKREDIDLTRVSIWMAIIFAVVAFRDQYIQVYHYALEFKHGVM